jgi:hypothetical protein
VRAVGSFSQNRREGAISGKAKVARPRGYLQAQTEIAALSIKIELPALRIYPRKIV